MSEKWNYAVECCGNCAFWPLGNYQIDIGSPPLGAAGPNTDGTVSECRRHSPVGVYQNRYPLADRIFPSTVRDDFCGEFEKRG